MTVAELIKELRKQPKDAQVRTEGCDCDGDVGKVTFQNHVKKSERYVYLERS